MSAQPMTALTPGIESFRGLHRGKRVFILASGPSLRDHDLSPLRRRLTIGLNRSPLIWPETHYHCTMDERLFDEHPEVLRAARYLFTLEGRPFGIPLRLLGAEGFSLDLRQGIHSGYTVAYFALQVAVYMGFSDVIYLGLDLCHRDGQTHFFGSDFRSRDHESTEFPRMARMMVRGIGFAAALGVRVRNASPLSTLDGIERISYADAIAL